MYIKVIEYVEEDNKAPYFADWDMYSSIQAIAFVGEVRAQIPTPLDDDIDQFGQGDVIEIDFDFRTMATFAEWDP